VTGARPARPLPGRFVLAVTVGGVIGLGILRGPGEIAAVVAQPSAYLSLWFFGGLFVLLSTAVTAELLGMTPRSGGAYSLIRRAYGPYAGFVIGWVDWLSFAADLALKAVVVLEFTAILAPGTEAWQTPLAMAVTTAFAAIQLRGIRLGALIQELATSLIGLVVVLLSLLLLFAGSSAGNASAPSPANAALGDWSASYFSGEIRGGAGTAARTCIKGMVVVIALYMLINVALVKSAGLDALAGSDLALARALELAALPAAGSIIVIAAILILLSHQNLAYMGGPRILQALAEDGLAAKRAETVGRGGNPGVAVICTWLLAVGLIAIGGFEFLLLLSVFFYVPIYLAMIVGVIILRRREPGGERPYRAWAHPYSTAVCLAGWTVVTLFQAYSERQTALYALAMIAVSWPAYRYLSHRQAREAPN
jgi:APA family basic amino acid/polyamine antiporter